MRLGFILFLFLASLGIYAQDAMERPPIWGVAKMTFLVSDFNMAREYYGKFLGFDEAFTYDSDSRKIISFKVNDRQFLEFIEDAGTKNKTRMVSVSLETGNVDQMHAYLKSSGIDVPEKVLTDGAANKVFLVTDMSGNTVEFIEFTPDGLHRKSWGKLLSEQRISKRIHHAGLYTKVMSDEDPFYTGILKFVPILRYPEDKNQKPVMIYFGMADCTESIEHYLSDDINFSHPCFLVDDMQETVYTLKERNAGFMSGKPIIGKGKRWILNLNNPDGTRVEFTEAYTVR
jgi:catechol 2,3-dioxygenase-like lactoylglutathione lyase family enzyme